MGNRKQAGSQDPQLSLFDELMEGTVKKSLKRAGCAGRCSLQNNYKETEDPYPGILRFSRAVILQPLLIS